MAGATQARARNRSSTGKASGAKNGARTKDGAASRTAPDRAGSGQPPAVASPRPVASPGQTRAGQARAGQARAGQTRPGQTRPGQTRKARDRAQARQLAQQAEIVKPEVTGPPLWLQLASLVLAVGGLGVSTYLTIAHYTSSKILACSETCLVNCSAVTTSPQSKVFGILPVAVLGLAFFVFMVPMTTPWAWRSPRREIALARLASVIVGVGFILYLIYVELIQVKAICLWCTSVHVITFLLFVLVTFAAAIWGLPKASGRNGLPGR